MTDEDDDHTPRRIRGNAYSVGHQEAREDAVDESRQETATGGSPATGGRSRLETRDRQPSADPDPEPTPEPESDDGVPSADHLEPDRAARPEGALAGDTGQETREQLQEDVPDDPQRRAEQRAAGRLRGEMLREDPDAQFGDLAVERTEDGRIRPADEEIALRQAAREAGPDVSPQDLRIVEGRVQWAEDRLREHVAGQDERLGREDVRVVQEDGEQRVEVTEAAQRRQLRQQVREEYGEDARIVGFDETDDGRIAAEVDVGDETIDVVGGARQLATDPQAFFGETIRGRAERRFASERRQIEAGVEQWRDGVAEAAGRIAGAADSVTPEPPDGEQDETADRVVPLGAQSRAALFGGAALVGGGVIAAREGRPAAQASSADVVVESEIEVGEDARPQAVDEVPVVRDQFVESEVDASGDPQPDEIETPDRRQAERGEVGVPESPAWEQPEIDVGRDADREAQRISQDDSVVPDDYPLPGRDVPADPTRDYVPGQQRDPALETAALQQGGVLRERQDERVSPWERHRRELEQSQQDEQEWLEEDATLVVIDGELREVPEWHDQDSFVFPGSEGAAEATESELDVEQAVRDATANVVDAGARTGSSARTAAAVDTAVATTQAVEADLEANVAADVAATPDFGYPTQQQPGYGFGHPTAHRPARQTRPGRPFDLPSFDFGADGREDPGADADTVVDEWERPVADVDEVFGGGFSAPEMPDFDVQTPGFDRPEWE